jgi:hypothetical protein
MVTIMKCPSFETLINYLDDQLTVAEGAAVAEHLQSGCTSCAETRDWYENVRLIASSDDSVEPPPWILKRAIRVFENQHSRPGVVERIGAAVASLVFDSFSRPAVAGVRSTETAARQMLYRAGNYSIDLQIESSGQSLCELKGQVLREGETAFESVRRLALELAGESETRSAVTDQMGEFAFGGVRPGDYELRIKMVEGTITIPGLPITHN